MWNGRAAAQAVARPCHSRAVTDLRGDLVAAIRDNWRREWESAVLYSHLAGREPDARRRGILLRLAETEERHAARWTQRLTALGAPPPGLAGLDVAPGWVTRHTELPVLLRLQPAQEDGQLQEYEALARASGDDESARIAREIAADEREHALTLRALGAPHSPRSLLDSILGRERWHVRGGGWIGDAIYGANDGLGAVFGIVSGVAGATSGRAFGGPAAAGGGVVLISGLAGMLASAISMGSGAFLAARAEREIAETEIGRERAEVAEHPEEERTELELFFELKGFSSGEARRLVDRLAEQPEEFLRTMAHEELGLSEVAFPNPWRAGATAAASTAAGAFVPLVPFFFTAGTPAVLWSAAVSIAARWPHVRATPVRSVVRQGMLPRAWAAVRLASRSLPHSAPGSAGIWPGERADGRRVIGGQGLICRHEGAVRRRKKTLTRPV